MITISKFNGKCWICGSIADSKEHRYKKTDIKREFINTGPKGDRVGVISNDTDFIEIQGPNSERLKFDKVICKQCNNKFTQPFDNAYDKFILFILNNIQLLTKCKSIDFSSIFPNNTKNETNNLFKYLIKHFGCRLAENNFMILEDLVDFINGRTPYLTSLIIRFEADYSLYAILKKLKDEDFMYSNLYKGSLGYINNLNNPDQIHAIYTSYTNQWFKIHFVYSDIFESDIKDWMKQYYSDSKIPIKVSGLNIDDTLINNMTADEIVSSIIDSNKKKKPVTYHYLIHENIKNPYFE